MYLELVFPRSDGFAGDPLPGADQHLQLDQQRFPQRRRHDGHLSLDARMHVLHLWSAAWLRLHPLLPTGDYCTATSEPRLCCSSIAPLDKNDFVKISLRF